MVKQMTVEAVDTITLKELLAPSASSILNEGRVVRDDKSRSLWLLAQDAFGWQNWLSEREIPFEGNAQELFYQAAEKLRLSREEADDVLKSTRTEKAIPACVYKGNEDESIDGKGDVVAWGHLFNLKPTFSTYCPPEIKADVSHYIAQYRQHVPKPNRTPERPQQAFEKPETSDIPSKGNQTTPEAPSLKSPTIEKGYPVKATASQSLNTSLAQLSREIVDRMGEQQGGQRNVNGNVKYRISVNLRDNTMRIYARDRGDEPILVDANGQIDHANSRVSTEDVERFQQMVDSLRTYQTTYQSARESQLAKNLTNSASNQNCL